MPWLAHAIPDADERDDALRSDNGPDAEIARNSAFLIQNDQILATTGPTPQPGTDGLTRQDDAARPCPDSVSAETEDGSVRTD